MQENTVAVFIPARLNSSRLPRKMLEPINGKPLLLHVLDRANSLNLYKCYVACCCEELKKVVEEHGGKAILTDPELPSGTDRVFAALETLDDEEKPEFVVNLQGDTAVFDENVLPVILNVLRADSSIDITTPVTLDESASSIKNENVVKVVFDNMEKNQPGKAFYFSRSFIPHGTTFCYSHIGIYAYRYKALKQFVSLPSSFLENSERLEQLRAIQNGLNVWAIPVDCTAISVDVEEDLKRVLNFLNSKRGY
jgi:3-deoxy-manno-octulosonate cytidylyltransferase (CMP-KDO synthetase)